MVTRKKPAAAGVAPELFSDLNASFYGTSPCDYFLLKVQTLSLLLAPEPVLSGPYGASRTLGAATFDPSSVPPEDRRALFVRTESLMTFHHAAETLLRMHFAHVDPDQVCPWLAVADETNFRAFKEKVAAHVTAPGGFRKDHVAFTFFGGADPQEAGVRLTPDAFDDSVEAASFLLSYCGERFLAEAPAYNSAKHGLSNISVDESKIGVQPDGSEMLTLHDGPAFAFLGKGTVRDAQLSPNAPRQWYYNVEPALPDRDLIAAMQAAYAIDSIWAVGRRRFTGQSSSTRVFDLATVQHAVFQPIMGADSHLRRVQQELQRKNGAGAFDPMGISLERHPIPESYEGQAETVPGVPARVPLVVRQNDRRPLVASSRRMLMFSPNGSQSV